MKDFVKWDAEFVGSLDTVDLASSQLTNSDEVVADAEPDGQLANSANKAPDSEDNNVKEEMEVTTKKAKNDRNRKELANLDSLMGILPTY